MKLIEIAPLKKWVELEQDIYQRSGLDSNVFDTEGYRISDIKNWANRLCPAIKAIDKGQSFICAPAHMNIAMQAMRDRQPVIEACDAGLAKIVVPIFKDETFVGAVGCCGLLLDEEEVEPFLINKITDIEEETIEDLAGGIPGISMADAESLVIYIQQRIDSIIAGR